MANVQEVLKWHAELDGEVEPHPAFSLYRDSTALMVIDMQEKLGAAMPPDVWGRAVKNAVILIETAKRFELPIVVTEQYPKGLGPTVQPILDALPEGVRPLEKMDFSCGHLPPVREMLKEKHRRQLVVVGQETHVCVLQTVRDLVERGYFVHVARDGCTSRAKSNHETGLDLMAGVGATVSSTEVVVFDLLRTAEHEHFREISKLLR